MMKKDWMILAVLGVMVGSKPVCAVELGAVRKAIFKVQVISQEPDHKQPWNHQPVKSSSGTGFYIGPAGILTNAHVVANGKFISVLKDGDDEPVSARVKFMAHDCDLALIEVQDPGYLSGVAPIAFGDIPDVREDEYYELPGFDGPAQIKFLRGGAVGEGGRTALPVRVSVAPNPLVTSSAVRLAVRRAGDLRVEVYDGTGQVVRVLSSGRAAPGHVVLNWDGADSAGIRVSTGVYFVRAALDGSRSLAKVVVTE